MPATTVAHPAAGASSNSKAPTMLVPFSRAAKQHTEPIFDITQQMGSSSVQLPPQDIPAYGYLRGIWIEMIATGGSGTTTVTALEDAPWPAIQEVSLIDVNGAPIVGPFSGYDLYLLQKWGGYFPGSPDPKQSLAYSPVATGANASGNFSAMVYLPVEVNGRDGLGSLPNANAASTLKLRITVAPSSLVYGTAPTVLPAVRFRCHMDAWTQPTATDLRNNQQSTTPPAMGTTSFWSKTVINVPQGQQTIRLPRVGNYIREIIFCARAQADGTRATGDTLVPDPAALYWDTRLLTSYSKDLWREKMRTRSDFVNALESARGQDKGVFVADYCSEFDGLIGYELRDGWLPTSQSTRLELQGSWGGPVTLTVLTNDVSPAGDIFI
jgi:hypothetical protein